MNTYFSKAIVVALVGGALAIAGCGGGGGDSKADKAKAAQTKFADINKQLNDFGDELGTSITDAGSKTDDEIDTQFTSFADRANQQSDAVKDLDVPDDLTSTRDKLADKLSDGVDDLNNIASAGQTHDANAAASATRKLISDAKAIDSAQKALTSGLAADAK